MGHISLCIVCRRREPVRGHVCEPDRTGLAELLADLPRKLAALQVQLVPGAAAQGERVSTSRVESPLPARLDALSMLGPGADGVTAAFHPHVRRWATQHQVQVSNVVGGKGRAVTEVRTITAWHQELVRDDGGRVVQVPDDDQIGQLPPVEWLASWVRMWREHFGHARRLPDTLRAPARRAQVEKVRAQELTNQLLGLDTHNRGGDPLADEWETRFGEPSRADQPAADVKYLLTWLDEACEQGDQLDVAAMAAELRALSAELARIVGERPDQVWLGRCPATVTDLAGGDGAEPRVRPCGAPLWQEPFASKVQCPRCHATWGPRELIFLAKEIRRTWPIDRRRRYHLGEIEALRPPRCPTCGETAAVGWRDVTATTDDTRWWRPDKVVCPTGCPEAERLT